MDEIMVIIEKDLVEVVKKEKVIFFCENRKENSGVMVYNVVYW